MYDVEMEAQIKYVQQNRKVTCADELFNSGNTWEVTGNSDKTTSDCPRIEFK